MKTAVVTGAAQGLGLATVSMLAQRAFRVVLIDVQAVDGQLARLRTAGLRVDGISGDVSSESFVQQVAMQISRECGAADVLVNNAGISMIAPAEETTAAQWQKVMSVNLLGLFCCASIWAPRCCSGALAVSSMSHRWRASQGSATAVPTVRPSTV